MITLESTPRASLPQHLWTVRVLKVHPWTMIEFGEHPKSYPSPTSIYLWTLRKPKVHPKGCSSPPTSNYPWTEREFGEHPKGCSPPTSIWGLWESSGCIPTAPRLHLFIYGLTESLESIPKAASHLPLSIDCEFMAHPNCSSPTSIYLWTMRGFRGHPKGYLHLSVHSECTVFVLGM